MRFTEKYEKLFSYLLPTPFTIALVLTLFTYLLALTLTRPETDSFLNYSVKLLDFWEEGLWTPNLLAFTVQMMLMLVLGHTLALTPLVNKGLNIIVQFCTTTAKSAALITFLTILVSLFNWGLGLIFGAIFARKVGEYASQHNIPINYPLIGAAGYSGLMVWHGGLSGSSLSKIAEPNHLKSMMINLLSDTQLNALPERISYLETVWSNMNLSVMLTVIILLPLMMFGLGKKVVSKKIMLQEQKDKPIPTSSINVIKGAQRLDHLRIFSLLSGIVLFLYIIKKIVINYDFHLLDFFNPNNINLLLLSLVLLLHKNFISFLEAINKAISGTSGMLIQFPLYFGIMGIMIHSGLITQFADFFIQISSPTTYPIYTFFSAGLVNIFVPSGGGQWAVQGPIIVKSVLELGISLPKSIMALAYGDQLTNMLQPFWALPLLGITGLKAKEILPYTLFLMLLGGSIYLGALILF